MASQPFERDMWKRRVSNNSAAALIVFALMHILCLAAAASGHSMPLHLLALVLPVVITIPLIARFEAYWFAHPDLPAFRRAAALLWVGAVVTPFLWSGLYLLIG
jgi:uncharacterized membrane protein